MIRRSLLRAALLSSALGGFASPVLAQIVAPAPVRRSVDANGVDLFLGTMNVTSSSISMGHGDPQGLSYFYANAGNGWNDSITAALDQNGSAVTVRLGAKTDGFTVSGTTYTSTESKGATLTVSSGTYTYTSENGTVVRFSASKAGTAPYFASLGRAIDITTPSGAKLIYNYQQTQICTASKQGGDGQICTRYGYIYRLSGVTNSYGYTVSISYVSDDTGQTDDGGASGLNLGPWSTPNGAILYNLENSNLPNVVLQSATNGSTFTVTDTMNRTTSYRMSGAQVAGITRAGSASENVTVAYTSGRVSSVTTAVGTTTYSAPSDASGIRTVTVTPPGMQATTYTFDIASNRLKTIVDPLGRIVRNDYDASGRLTQVTAPEGNYTQYAHDTRGNVTTVTQVAKMGAGLANIVTASNYAATCTNAVTCNSPTYTLDARGSETDYAYDPTHGGVTSVTAPAPTGGAVRPQTRYSYTSYSDYFGGTIYRQTGSSTCRTQASCSGTADETVASTGYGSLSANNLLAVSSSAGAGDGSLTANGSVGYDPFGNVIVSTDALGNQTHYSYDADRERTETISPDPDGGGPLKARASRTTYNADGTVAQVDVGTDTGNNFVSLQTSAASYDAALRPVRTTTSAGGTTYAVVQYAYDATGRLQCTAQRMNPGAFGALPAACSLGTAGSFGNDRISYTHYDTVGRMDYVTSAYQTGDAATEHVSYTTNGKTGTVSDANGNVTTYGYDGLDRVVTTTYPGGSYDQVSYDANGNVTTRRLRDANSYSPSYDALDRMTNDGQSHTYSYDNLGRLLSANDPNNAYENFSWDALGRKTSESAALGGTSTFQYDAAGRRTRQTWADGFYVTYGYDTLGEMAAIYENGGTVLASFGYDDLGRRTSLSRANGTSTSYGYDAASRLTALTLNGGPSNGYTFAYDPAGQITSRTSSNDAFAWTAAANVDRSYSVNGLNQYTASGSVTPTYDGRGNLTSAGGTSYSYNLMNQLTNFSGGYIYRNALGEWLDVNVEQQWMVHDGDRTIEEYGYDGTVHRRYVYGPGSDEPLIWYEGPGTSDRRFLHADERGSIVAVSDNAGGTVAINSYDEYGIPGATNIGRFQYTGQRWIPALGMYDYKARMYSPTLGRFLQTDPIGYGDGLNWYNYVGGDPVNGADPSGMEEHLANAGNTTQCPPGTTYVGTTINGVGPGSGLVNCEPNKDLNGDIVVTGTRAPTVTINPDALLAGGSGNNSTAVGSVPQSLNRNGQKPPSHDEGDPYYNKDLNKCRALADAGNKAAASTCYGNAEKRKRLRDDGVPEYDLPPLVKSAAAGVAAGVLFYWLISEGSRLFPPRNLVPIP